MSGIVAGIATIAAAGFLGRYFLKKSAPKPKVRELKVVSWNVNTDPRTDPFKNGMYAKTHEKFEISHRINRIKPVIRFMGADIIMLQEMTPEIAELIARYLTFNGYEVYIHQYTCRVNWEPFRYITAFFRDSGIEVLDEKQVYYSNITDSNGDLIGSVCPNKKPGDFYDLPVEEKKKYTERNFGDDTEKSYVRFDISFAGKYITVINTHFGLRSTYKEKSAEILGNLPKNGDLVNFAIIGGDFNFFNGKGETHIETMKKHYKDAIPDGHTFHFYEYDIGIGLLHDKDVKELTDRTIPASELARRFAENKVLQNGYPFGGKLDYIFYTGDVKVKKAGIHRTPDIIDETDGSINWDDPDCSPENIEAIKKAIYKSNRKQIPLFPSDHFPVYATFEFQI